jgi:hypothetical protein
MPAAAAVFVGTLINGLIAGTAGLIAGTITGWATYGAVALGISYALGAVTQALMGRPKGLGNPGYRDSVITSTTAPRAIVYGECTIGGVVVFVYTTGSQNGYLDFVVALAGHQVSEITDVWFDDVKIANADINGGAAGGGNVGGSGAFRPRDGIVVAQIWKYLGTSAQTASPVLTTNDVFGYPTIWTAAHRLRGCAYVHIRLRRHEKAYSNGAPSGFKFRVKGAKVYDPRLDTTNGGSGSHRLEDATTWAYSNNPALCAADFIAGGSLVNDITTPIRKRGFAVASPATSIDWASVTAAANICDENCAVPTSTTQNRYECDGIVVPSDDTPDSDCLDQILTSMLGQVTFTKGVYTMYAGAYQSPVYTLTEADLAGDLKYVTGKGRTERYNYVRGTRYDQELGHELEFLSRTDAAYVTEDGRTLYHDIELPMTVNEYRAQRIAQTILRRSREQQSIVWPGQMSAAKIAVWETCYVTVAELGITNKVFRCVSRRQRPTGEGGEPVIELTLREESSSTYTDPAEGDYGTISVASDPGPVTGMLDPPDNVIATAVPNGVVFTITPDDGAGTSEVYDIYEYTAATPFASASLICSANSTVVFIPKGDATVRYYWVVARRNEYISDPFPTTTGIAVGSSGVSSSLSATISHSTISTTASGATVTTASVTAAGVSGTPTYTYAWTKLSGDTITITSASSASTTFVGSTMAYAESRTATFRCRVTDSAAATADVQVVVTVTRGGMTAAASPTSLYTSSFSSPITSSSVTVTPTGGTAAYTYAWTKVSGDTLTVNSPTSASTTFTASVTSSKTAIYRCTVTDSLATTATADVTITLDREFA